MNVQTTIDSVDQQCNNIDFLHEKQVLKSYDSYKSKIKDLLTNTVNNYIKIGGLLKNVKEQEFFKKYEYKDVYDYAEKEFGLGRTSTKNFINVFEKFGQEIDNDSIELKPEYTTYSYSQLVEMVPVPEEKLETITPDMSVREIRAEKQRQALSDIEQEMINSVVNEFKQSLNYSFNVVIGCQKFKIKNPTLKACQWNEGYYDFTSSITFDSDAILIEIRLQLINGFKNAESCVKTKSFNYNYEYSRENINSADELRDQIIDFYSNKAKSFYQKQSNSCENEKKKQEERQRINQIGESIINKSLTLKQAQDIINLGVWDSALALTCKVFQPGKQEIKIMISYFNEYYPRFKLIDYISTGYHINLSFNSNGKEIADISAGDNFRLNDLIKYYPEESTRLLINCFVNSKQLTETMLSDDEQAISDDHNIEGLVESLARGELI